MKLGKIVLWTVSAFAISCLVFGVGIAQDIRKNGGNFSFEGDMLFGMGKEYTEIGRAHV